MWLGVGLSKRGAGGLDQMVRVGSECLRQVVGVGAWGRWRVSVECVGCCTARFWGVRHVFSCGVYFFFIPVGEGWSLLPCQRVMHLSAIFLF